MNPLDELFQVEQYFAFYQIPFHINRSSFLSSFSYYFPTFTYTRPNIHPTTTTTDVSWFLDDPILWWHFYLELGF